MKKTRILYVIAAALFAMIFLFACSEEELSLPTNDPIASTEEEETTYLLLFGDLPTKEQLDTFKGLLGEMQELTAKFIRDVIMKAPSNNIMNAMQKSLLTLYSYDSNVTEKVLFIMREGTPAGRQGSQPYPSAVFVGSLI